MMNVLFPVIFPNIICLASYYSKIVSLILSQLKVVSF